MKIIDISPEIHSGLAVFPGDTPFKLSPSLSIANGDAIDLSSIQSTVHIGAHTDAPSHYKLNAEGMNKRDLDFYYGDCQIITVKKELGARIFASDIQGIAIIAPRVIFRTDSYLEPDDWRNDFNALSADLIEYLAKQSVRLVGIDTPSIDLAESKDLEAHQAVAKNDMAILEGVLLNDTSDKLYTLIALPLKIRDADASPVRAVLLDS